MNTAGHTSHALMELMQSTFISAGGRQQNTVPPLHMQEMLQHINCSIYAAHFPSID